MASLVRAMRLRPAYRNVSKLQVEYRQFHSSQPRFMATAEAVKKKRSMGEHINLEGQTTIITGGARGIGLSLVEAAAEAGSNVAVFDRLDEPQRDLSKLGVKAKCYRY